MNISGETAVHGGLTGVAFDPVVRQLERVVSPSLFAIVD
jgi:hypothetical protein